MKQYIPTMKRIALWGLGGLVIALLAFIGFSFLPGEHGYDLKIVTSGSMEPAISTGSVVAVRPAESYQVGDIITFSISEEKRGFITHRIIRETAGGFVTQGDANNAADTENVAREQVLGKVLFSVPWLGFLFGFAQSGAGMLLLVVLPAGALIVSEARRLLKEFSNKKGSATAGNVAKKGVVVLLASALIVLGTPGATHAFFQDDGDTSANSFQASVWATPGDVVVNEIMWMGSDKSSADEWIELRNTTGHELSLDGWIIKNAAENGGDLAIPSGTIPANGYFLIANDNEMDSAMSVTPDMVDASLSLANKDNGNLVLKDQKATTIDSALADPPTWGAGSNGNMQKQSMQRLDKFGDGLQASNWETCLDTSCRSTDYWDASAGNYGTPAHNNLTGEDIVLNEFLPNASQYPEYIELYNINSNSEWENVVNWKVVISKNNNIQEESRIDSQHIYQGTSTFVGPAGSGSEWLALDLSSIGSDVLPDSGATITLYDNSGIKWDEVTYPLSGSQSGAVQTPDEENRQNSNVAPEDKSFARIPDGTGDWVDPIPTPGASNTSSTSDTDTTTASSDTDTSDTDNTTSTPQTTTQDTDTNDTSETQDTQNSTSTPSTISDSDTDTDSTDTDNSTSSPQTVDGDTDDTSSEDTDANSGETTTDTQSDADATATNKEEEEPALQEDSTDDSNSTTTPDTV